MNDFPSLAMGGRGHVCVHARTSLIPGLHGVGSEYETSAHNCVCSLVPRPYTRLHVSCMRLVRG